MIQPAANPTRADRYEYKAALVTALAKNGGDFHVVAQLPVGRSRAALEDALYAWVAPPELTARATNLPDR